jgi:CRP/FNR family transcriptional regulator
MEPSRCDNEAIARQPGRNEGEAAPLSTVAKELKFLRMPVAAGLPDLPVFRGLAAEARRVLASAPQRRFARGETLWVAGTDAHSFVIVLEGLVRVVRAPAGRQYAVHTEGPGGTLGDVPFFAGGRYPATAVAVDATRCLMLDRGRVTRVIAADPDFAIRLLARLSTRVRGLVERLDRQQASTVEQRLAELLLRRQAEAGNAPFRLASSQAEAAEELGTVREVLVRSLRALREGGVVQCTSRGWYVVTDARALMARASVVTR